MRTNIEIDDALIAEAQAVSGAITKKETVQLGLEALVRLGRQARLHELRGQLRWDGDLQELRLDAS
ncbi:MAG TPA: type II toxin-antitoxin system VapB family antitoxin [Lacisediminihabitans sp.]|uniref:type II toxin-antitoxin system VapB family antitoxin n=1 Tax=Lacisediminihabitans sp. TaxID=2787631 RepID=UPI002EDA124A